MPRRTLSLDLEGPQITVDRFLQALDGLLTVLHEVDRSLTASPRGSLRFIITDLRKNSAHLEAVAEPVEPDARVPPDAILDAVVAGLETIQSAKGQPDHFTNRALEGAIALSHALRRNEVSGVTVRWGRRHVGVTDQLGTRAQELVHGTLRNLGTVEGRLEVLSVHKRTKAVIYESVTGRAVRCFFPEAELPLVMSAFGRRVAAHGVIWSTVRGEPQSIDVESAGDIVVFPRDQDLPKAADVRGVLRG